jgi:sugar lactone lactonase YvrE
MDPALEQVVAAQNELGEGPLWHPEEAALYWVDIRRNRVERYRPESRERRTYQFDMGVTALGLRARGGFVAATTQGFALWDGASESLHMLSNPIAGTPHTRFNDGAVDRQGRFWAGTMYEGPETDTPAEGLLFRLDPDGSLHQMESGLTISNGLGWSPDSQTMYLTDTLRSVIYAYSFDKGTGQISGRRVFATVPEDEGFPDGLAVDSDGCVWSARWGGSRVVQYSAGGQVMGSVSVPVSCPTSCAFGGAGLRQLYITSAWMALSERERQAEPLAGDLFRMQVGRPGLPPQKFLG